MIVVGPESRTQLITFYSYKGGVGRTMALANAACQLAIKHGKNVICVDWDLEAPGLHQYFSFSDVELAERPGLLDYLEDFVAEVKKGSQGKTPDLKNYLQELKPEQKQAIKFGSVRLMHCGRTDSRYMARVERFNWDELYRLWHGYEIIETLKKQLRAEADMTLFDARAGQADIGVVPTIQIPDALVILFTSNRQSLLGMETMARSFHHHPRRVAQELPDPKMLLVPSRVFPEEETFQDWMDDVAGHIYEKLAGDGIVSRRDQPKGLRQCILAVDPKYSIDETLVVIDASRAKSPLKDSYFEFAQALDNLYYGREAIWPDRAAELARDGVAGERPREDLSKLRSELDEAAKRGDRGRVAALQSELGYIALEESRLDEAETMYQSALAYQLDTEDKFSAMTSILYLGDVAARLGKGDRALELYRRSFDIALEQGDKYWQAAALDRIGNVLGANARADEAWEAFQRGLAIAEGNKDLFWLAIIILDHMGDLRCREGRIEEAIALYERAFETAQSGGDKEWQGIILRDQGRAYSEMRDLVNARTCFQRAIDLATEIGDNELADAVRAEVSKLESRAARS
jgi:tetratricopeptide (TPR) repeat protein